MRLHLAADRNLVWSGGGSFRHLHVRYVAPVVTGTRPRPPVRLGLCLDRSGSMGGGKLETAKAALLSCLGRLAPDDHFSITTFDDTVKTDVPMTAATGHSIARARSCLAEVRPGGSTNLFRGFLTACASIAEGLERDTFARCLVLTDGQANVEVKDAAGLARHAREVRERGITLSTFGVGIDVDEDLLRALADAGTGNYFFVESVADIERHVRNELGDVLEVSQRDVVMHIDLPPGVQGRWVGPALGEFGSGRLSIPLGNLASGEVNDTIVQLRFPKGAAGDAFGCVVTVADRDQPAAANAALEFAFAEGTENNAQSRVAAVDHLAAGRHADLARLQAVRLNRQGRYEQAAGVVRAVREHLARYMGDDPVLNALHAALGEEENAYRTDIGESSRKQRQFTSSSRARSKSEFGTASRGGDADE